MKTIALYLWMVLFGGDSDDKEKKGGQDRAAMQEKRAMAVPWPMVCNFIVRVIDGPADTAIVVAKRDCPQ